MRRATLLLLFLSMTFRGFSQNEMKIQMVYVKGGSFYMGCDDPKFLGEEYADERPLHRVSISSFYLCKYEVTLGQYRHIMGMYPAAYNGIDYGNKYCDDCPVVKLTWDEAQEFIKRVNKKYNKHYRLPTEAEWEFAARGGIHSKNAMYSGDNNPGTVAWYGKRNGTTHPVGQKEPNELGLYDMSGNVAEWCADWYGANYYQNTVDAADPKGPDKGDKKICRGGSYFDDDVACRVVDRGKYEPKTSQWNIGFRMAMDEHPGKE